jgi:nitrate/TMAO reductase-like tetraheme cytochrome c subunit
MRWRPSALVLAGLILAASAVPAEAQLGALISPGRLAKAHASLEGLSHCQQCHEPGQRVTAAKCLACHQPIADRIKRGVGVHRNVKDDCVSCHAEHAGVDGELRPFDTASFDHAAVTGFALDGKHAAVAGKCDACHKTRSFLTLKPACASCHQDAHQGRLGSDCGSCHTVDRAFADVGTHFDHSRAAFKLTGAHRTVACQECHKNSVYEGIAFASCADCHRDPHTGTFGTSCTSCHADGSWRTTKVDHSRTSFALVGKHATLACDACHKQPAVQVKLQQADRCATCHADVHRGNFSQDCKACHSEFGFDRAVFDHSTTGFSLEGKHAGIACADCHKGVVIGERAGVRLVADFSGLKTACASCHADVHRGQLGATCETCHTPATFGVTSFTHPQSPEFFAGQHAAVACAACHVPAASVAPAGQGAAVLDVTFRNLSMACASCHKDVHLGQEGAACAACHTVQQAKFAVSDFAHTKTAFPLTGRHASVACADCHKEETGVFPAGRGTAIRLKGTSTECRSCHADVHLGQLGSACATCHTTDTFHLTSYTHRDRSLAGFFVGRHAKAACEACHKTATGSFPAGPGTAVAFKIGTACVNCHEDQHHGALGTRCGDCHQP